jgi:hypothetical protein
MGLPQKKRGNRVVSKQKAVEPASQDEDEFHGNDSYNPDFQVPATAGYEFITPDIAKAMLEAGNRNNRHVGIPPVNRLRGAMDRYEWMYDSTDAIGLADDGAVVNGQHRLTTIKDGDKGVWMLVVRGVRKEVIRVIDQGIGRTLTQTLTIDGGYVEPGTTATAIKWLYRMGLGLERQVPGALLPTIPQELALLTEHPHIVDSLESAGRVYARLKVLSKGILTAYHYVFATVDPDLAETFFDKLATGIGASNGDPAHVLRERWVKDMGLPNDKKLRPFEAAHFLVLAWEAERAGEQLDAKKLRFTKSGKSATKVATPGGVDWLGTMPEPEEDA